MWVDLFADYKSESIISLDNWMGLNIGSYWTPHGHFNYFCDLLLTGIIPESQRSCLPELWEIAGSEIQVNHINHFWGFVSVGFHPKKFLPQTGSHNMLTLHHQQHSFRSETNPSLPGYIFKIKTIVSYVTNLAKDSEMGQKMSVQSLNAL